MSTLPRKDDIDRFDMTVASGYGMVITPADDVDLSHGARGVYVGTTGMWRCSYRVTAER